ncbi:MAG: hypothetical protein KJ709_07350 [Nanoarchaeota archaeon]|nr:hypothetical protein [Nanoarchaeota archaeon]
MTPKEFILEHIGALLGRDVVIECGEPGEDNYRVIFGAHLDGIRMTDGDLEISLHRSFQTGLISLNNSFVGGHPSTYFGIASRYNTPTPDERHLAEYNVIVKSKDLSSFRAHDTKVTFEEITRLYLCPERQPAEVKS